jgi:PAS domain S-box-containing protein
MGRTPELKPQVVRFSMHNKFKRFSVIAGFAFLLIVLIGNGLLTRREVGAQFSTERRLAESRRLMLELETTESLLKDAETGQRGFLYTGDLKYLAPYQLAQTEIEAHFVELMRMTAGDPQQQASIVELRALEQVKMGELAQTIALYQAGKADDARTVVLSNYGLLAMNRFRQVIDRLEKQEAALESTRNAHYQKTVRETIASIYLASLLATIGLVMLAYYILHEMSLRESHAQQIREREEWFRVTLTSIGDAVMVTDHAGMVSFLNPVAEMLTGRSLAEVKGHDILEVFPIFNEATQAPAENPVSRVMIEGQVVGLANHTALRHADGYMIPIEDSAAPIRDDRGKLIGVVLVFRDVTDERRSQEMMRKGEKLAAAARLSATVAHEINNPLEAVANLIYIAKITPGSPPEAIQHLESAEHELERVAHITRQTLGFYRESNVPGPIELPAMIDSVLRLYSNKLMSKNIHVLREFSDCAPMHGVAGEMKQVLSNLILNAIDAVASHGTIRIRLEHANGANGGIMQLVVEDDGPGISPENVDRVFEPFFTTKKDVGTGLGLWVTREIIERHGGTISIVTKKGEDRLPGACFVINLPCNSGREAEDPPSLLSVP